MAKGNEAQTNVTWGTLEELLLACAVSRYGTSCWDSVAREIQKRSSGCRLLTPQNCKQKYHELKNRFTARNGYDNNTPPIDGSENGDAVDTCLWQDELRKIRIAELKRELELYDLSIMSLQSKVEKLKEERERSLRENEKEETDLEKSQVRYRVDDLKETKNIPEISSPEQGCGREVSVGESAREKLSVNESNSTDPKGDDNLENRVGEKENDSAAPAVGHINPGKGTARPAGEASYNGSSDTIAPAKEYSSSQNCDSAKADPAKESIDSPELLESVAESKGRREKETKESSDVQSSSSLSRKLRREKVASGGNEPEAENQSLAVKPSIVISQPLVDFLEVIRSHKLGSMFERRLECQRTTRYMNLIRQHIDLQTIRTRLDEGHYSDHHANFYRDLLLLINNAIVFFPKKSSEHKAAVELRQLVSKRLPRSAAKQGPEQHLTKREREAEDSLLFKPKISMPVIVCRKRSSTVAKASVGGRKRGEAVLIGNDEKKQQAAGDAKKPEKSTSISAVTKQRTMDQGFDSRNSSRNGKSQICDPPNKSSEKQATSGPKVLGIDGASGNENSEATLEKKNSKSNARTVNSKKQGAANFLNRIRRNSSPNDAFLSESIQKSAVNADNGKGSEQKKSSSGHNNYKSEGSRDHSSRKGSGSKAAKEMQRGGVAKKDNAGRPLMRVVATTATRQRRRAHGEAEAVPKKRQRK